VRHALNLDDVPAGVTKAKDDNIVHNPERGSGERPNAERERVRSSDLRPRAPPPSPKA
jgi:hypothetical protein